MPMKKKKTFYDLIDSAEYLIEEKWTSKDRRSFVTPQIIIDATRPTAVIQIVWKAGPRWSRIARIVLSRVAFYGLILLGAWWWMPRMPGHSAEGPLPPLTPVEIELRSRLRRDVEVLA